VPPSNVSQKHCRYGSSASGSDPGRWSCSSTVGPTQPPVKGVPEVKQPGRDADD
jgi:hypothetical protein